MEGIIHLPKGCEGTLDIDMPSPAEIAKQLEESFPQHQAEAIAQYVYQPIREVLKNRTIGGLK